MDNGSQRDSYRPHYDSRPRPPVHSGRRQSPPVRYAKAYALQYDQRGFPPEQDSYYSPSDTYRPAFIEDRRRRSGGDPYYRGRDTVNGHSARSSPYTTGPIQPAFESSRDYPRRSPSITSKRSRSNSPTLSVSSRHSVADRNQFSHSQSRQPPYPDHRRPFQASSYNAYPSPREREQQRERHARVTTYEKREREYNRDYRDERDFGRYSSAPSVSLDGTHPSVSPAKASSRSQSDSYHVSAPTNRSVDLPYGSPQLNASPSTSHALFKATGNSSPTTSKLTDIVSPVVPAAVDCIPRLGDLNPSIGLGAPFEPKPNGHFHSRSASREFNTPLISPKQIRSVGTSPTIGFATHRSNLSGTFSTVKSPAKSTIGLNLQREAMEGTPGLSHIPPNEIEEGEDVEMGELNASLPDGSQHNGLELQEDHEPSQFQPDVDVVGPESPIVTVSSSLQERTTKHDMQSAPDLTSDIHLREDSLKGISSHVVQLSSPQLPTSTLEHAEYTSQALTRSRESSTRPRCENFDQLLRDISNRYYSEDHVEQVIKNRKAGPETPIRPVQKRKSTRSNPEIPNEAFLAVHEAILPFLQNEFMRETLERQKRVQHLRQDYLELNKDWKVHCRKMEKIRARHQKKPILQHQHIHPAALSAMGIVPPGTPSIDNLSAYPFPDEVSTPYSATAPYFGSAANTPGPLSARTGRRSMAASHGDAVRSEAEFLEILASLENADMLDPSVRAARSAAVVPDMLTLDDPDRELRAFDNENALVQDPAEYYGIGAAAALRSDPAIAEWTDEDVQIFCKRYALYPKQFGKIASHLSNKSIQQCVTFYYRSKDSIDFRSLSERRTKDGKKRKPRLGNPKKGSALLSNIRSQDKDEEEEPSSRPKASFSTYINGKRSIHVEMATDADEGVGSAATKRIIYGSSKRVDAEALRAKRYQARVVPPLPMTLPTPADGLLTSAEALSALTEASSNAENEDQGNFEDASAVKAMESEDRAAYLKGGKKKPSTSSYWSVFEKTGFSKLLATHGKDWDAIADGLGSKTSVQCRNFFANNKAKLSLDAIAKKAIDEGSEDTGTMQDNTLPGIMSPVVGFDGSKTTLPSLQHIFDQPRHGHLPLPHSAYHPPYPERCEQIVSTTRPTSGMRLGDLLNHSTEESKSQQMDQDWFGESRDQHENDQELAAADRLHLRSPTRNDFLPGRRSRYTRQDSPEVDRMPPEYMHRSYPPHTYYQDYAPTSAYPPDDPYRRPQWSATDWRHPQAEWEPYDERTYRSMPVPYSRDPFPPYQSMPSYSNPLYDHYPQNYLSRSR